MDRHVLALEEPVKIADGYAVGPGDGLRGEARVAEMVLDVAARSGQQVVIGRARTVVLPLRVLLHQRDQKVGDVAGQQVAHSRRDARRAVREAVQEGSQQRPFLPCCEGAPCHRPQPRRGHVQHLSGKPEEPLPEALPLLQGEGPPRIDHGQVAREQRGAAPVLCQGRAPGPLEGDDDPVGRGAVNEPGRAAQAYGIRLQRQHAQIAEMTYIEPAVEAVLLQRPDL